MKKTWNRLLSMILALTLVAGLLPLQTIVQAAEPIRLTEDSIGGETVNSGAFYLASSSAKLNEAAPGPYYLRVARGGDMLPKATVRFEMMDISTKYGEDYTVSVAGSGLFAPEVENADSAVSVMEGFQSGGYEQAMLDENGNDLSLTDEAARQEQQRAADEIGARLVDSLDQYAEAKAVENGIDPDVFTDDKASREGIDLARSADEEPQSEMSRQFEEQTGLTDDRTPLQNSGSDDSSLGEVLYAGFGLETVNELASELSVPSLTLNFAEGETEKGVLLTLKNNDKGEGDKMMIAKLVCDTENLLVAETNSGFTLTIEDDEEWKEPVISFTDAAYSPEGGCAMVTVKREGLSTMVSTAHLTAADGSAKSGRDYSQADTDIVFPYGVNERMVKIPVRSEYLDSDADFSLTLSDPVGADLGAASATVVIPKDAESYKPDDLALTGAAADVSTVKTAPAIDLSVTKQAGVGDEGHSKMDGDKYSMKASSWVYDTVNSYASWSLGTHPEYNGVRIDWEKVSGKPAWSEIEVELNEYNASKNAYEYVRRVHNSDERWTRTATDVYSGSERFSAVYINNIKSGGMIGCDVTTNIYSIKPILRPFEIKLEDAETSKLQFVSEDNQLLSFSQIPHLQNINETHLSGGDVKFTEQGSDEVTVVLDSSAYCWIHHLELLIYDDQGNITGVKSLAQQPQGTRTASFKLDQDMLKSLVNDHTVRFVKNGSQGFKGKIGVRASLAPYPVNVTKADEGRAWISFGKNGNMENHEWHKGDYLTAEVTVDSEYRDAYYALGLEAHIRETGDSREKVRHWDNEIGKTFVSEKLVYDKVILKPWISENDNQLIVRLHEGTAKNYNLKQGFFTEANQIQSMESGYLYFVVADSDHIKPNSYYELTAIPRDEYYAAYWITPDSKINYTENTFYFQASVEKSANIITLGVPARIDSYLSLTGSVYYSDTVLDHQSEGEAWIPAAGAIVMSDDTHYAVADQNGTFTVDPTHDGQLPLYCAEGDGVTYKIISGGNVQYYRTVAKGKQDQELVRKVDVGKQKVPVTDESRPYIATAIAQDINSLSTSNVPITDEGVSTFTVTVNNCNSSYGENQTEHTRTVELLAYRPSNAEPITIAALSKDDQDHPYKPAADGSRETWTFKTSFGAGSGLMSSDRLYVRLTTDRASSQVYDEDGSPVADSAFSTTTYPPVNTGIVFVQPAAEEPETYDVGFMDGDFMKDYFSLPILGSMTAVFKFSNITLGVTPLPNGGQRISVGYIPEWAGKRSEDDGKSDTREQYGKFDFSKAWGDISEFGTLLSSTGQRLNVFNGGGVSAFFGVYLDFGVVLEDNNPTLEFMGGGAYLGAIAWYRVVSYFTVYGFPFYFGGDTQLNFMLSAGIHGTEEQQESELVYKDVTYGFDWSVSGNLTVNIYAGAGICGVIGVRGGAYLAANFIHWPNVAKWFANEDQALKNAGFAEGLRSSGMKISAGFKFWVDAVIATVPFTIKELVDKRMGYFEDLERLDDLDSHSHALASTGAAEYALTGEWSYKQAGEPSVWTASSSSFAVSGKSDLAPTGSTFHQTADIKLKTGGYDHADPQMLDLGDDQYLLVYVDEDSSIEGDDRTVLRYQIYDNSDKSNPFWLDVPGEINAMRGGEKINGALEPNLTDAGDSVLITWTAVTLPDATHEDDDYLRRYFKERDVYAVIIPKDELRNASSAAPPAFAGSLVSGDDGCYDTSPNGMYYQEDGKEYYGVTFLSSDAQVSDELSETEKLLTMATPTLNNSYFKTAQYNIQNDSWIVGFGAMKLNSTYHADSDAWETLDPNSNLLFTNNPTTIDIDTTIWGDWAIYTFAVDEDSNTATDEDREIYVKLENVKTRNATVNQLTHDGAYTDADGVEHLGIAKARPQLVKSGGTVYLFWQQGAEDIAWLDLGKVINSEKTDQATGEITDTAGLPVSMVFYPTYGCEVSPTYSGFKPFVDELDNLYIVWPQSITEDSVVKQELYASSFCKGAGTENTGKSWSDPTRLTVTDPGEYSLCYNDEPALISLGSEELLVVCNRFASTSDPDDVTAKNLEVRSIRFETVASVKPIDATVANPLAKEGETLELTVTVKNDGLKAAENGITLGAALVDKEKYEAAKTLADQVASFVDTEIYDYKDIRLEPGESVALELNKDWPDRTIEMPDQLVESGYKLIVMVSETKIDSGSFDIYSGMPYKEFDDLIKTEPVYSISLTADTYRNAKGTLGSEDFLFSAVISKTGNIALRDTDRLVVGPANLHHVNEVGEEEFYLDIPLAKLDDADTASSDSKTITTDLKIDPSEFTYGFVNLYADIVDKDGNSLGAVNSFAISADTPYSVTVKDKDTEQTLDGTFTLKEGESIAMTGSYEPSCHFRGGKVVYSVEDCGIASVDENGNLTAVSAGTTTLYASVDIYDAVRAYTVTVTPDDSYLIGDADSDGIVTILDATAIQRKLVSLPILGEFNEDAARLADDEEKLTIIDATFIQRWLAGLPTNNSIGKPRV